MSYRQYKLEWLGHDLTRDLIKTLSEDIDLMKDRWVAGSFTGASFDETAQLNAKALGIVESLERVLEYITSVEESEE